jgi:hypothetical protein
MKDLFQKLDNIPAVTQIELLFYFIAIAVAFSFFMYLGRNRFIAFIKKVTTPRENKIFKDPRYGR